MKCSQHAMLIPRGEEPGLLRKSLDAPKGPDALKSPAPVKSLAAVKMKNLVAVKNLAVVMGLVAVMGLAVVKEPGCCEGPGQSEEPGCSGESGKGDMDLVTMECAVVVISAVDLAVESPQNFYRVYLQQGLKQRVQAGKVRRIMDDKVTINNLLS